MITTKNIFFNLLLFSVFIIIGVTISFYIKINKKANKDSQKVIVSFTTTPARISKTKKTIDSLLNQTYNPDSIYINIPNKSYKGEDYIIPEWMNEYNNQGNIYINRISKDYGPGTKLLGLLEKEIDNETIIIYLDDDYIYGKNLVEFLVNNVQDYPDDVSSTRTQKINGHTIAAGYAGVGLKRKLISNEILDIPDKSCERGDDLWISSHFIKKNINIRKIFDWPHAVHLFYFNSFLDYSWEREARGNSQTNIENYKKCLDFLEI